jgi:hypothetical protein
MLSPSFCGLRSGLEMLVDASHVGHDLLPIWSLQLTHVAYILEKHGKTRKNTYQGGRYADALGSRKGQGEVALLLRGCERVVGYLVGQVSVQYGAKGEAVVPRAAEVGDVYVPVADGLVLAPLEQGVTSRASVLHEAAERILALREVGHAVAPHKVHGLGVERRRLQELTRRQDARHRALRFCMASQLRERKIHVYGWTLFWIRALANRNIKVLNSPQLCLKREVLIDK